MCGLFRGYLFVWKLVENLPKPQGFTSKFTKGVVCVCENKTIKTCKENEKDKHTTPPIPLKGMKKLGAKGPLLLSLLQL
jgi:hypothetical protein